MDHEDAFVGSIVENPDDDVPRLIFADWLEDHGESERAAFIRAQCRLATLDEDDPARPDLLRDEAAFLPRAKEMLAVPERPPWLAKIPDWATKALGYERGFPARLVTAAERFTAEAEALVAVVPLQHAGINCGQANRLQSLARCPALRRMRSLDAGGGRTTGADGVRSLVESPHVAGLTRLVLSTDDFDGDQTAAALADSPHLGGLRHLDLSHSRLRDQGVEALAASARLPNLVSLNLAYCHVGRLGVQALAHSRTLGRLRELNLASAHTNEAAGLLAASDRLAALERLDLSRGTVPPDGVRVLLRPRGLPNLKWLRLGSWGFPPDLWSVEPAERLRGRLSLHLPHLRAKAAVARSPLLEASRELEVGTGPREDFVALGRSRSVGGLVRLLILHERGGGTRKGAVAELARSLHFGSLRDLALSYNAISEYDVAALLDAPFIGQLTRLDLSYTQLTEGNLRLLARTDALAGIRELRLAGHADTASEAVRGELTARYGTRIHW